MSRQPRYFDLDGDEIDARHALDRHGALRDGVTLHIPLQLRDGLTPTQLSVRDAAARDARAQAYAAYDQEIQQAYRHGSMRDTPSPWAQADPRGGSFASTGFGSSGQRGDQPGDLCSIDGRPGRLKQVGSELRCVPDSRDSIGFTDHSGNPWSASRPGFRIRRVGDTRQAQRDAIAAYDREICNRWKCGDKQSVCQECSGSGLGSDGDTCIDCGGSGVIDDDFAVDSMPTPRPARVTDAAQHRKIMDKLYREYDQTISEQWRMR
jgi:hypothetical protein